MDELNSGKHIGDVYMPKKTELTQKKKIKGL